MQRKEVEGQIAPSVACRVPRSGKPVSSTLSWFMAPVTRFVPAGRAKPFVSASGCLAWRSPRPGTVAATLRCPYHPHPLPSLDPGHPLHKLMAGIDPGAPVCVSRWRGILPTQVLGDHPPTCRCHHPQAPDELVTLVAQTSGWH